MTRPVLALDPVSRARLLKSAQFSSHHNVKTRAGSQAETKKRISPCSLWPRGPGETIGWRGHMMWGGRSTFGCFNIPRIINQGHQMLLCSTLAAPTAHSGLPSSRSQRILWNLSNKQCSHCLIESVYYTLYSLPPIFDVPRIFLDLLKDCRGFQNKIPLIKLQWPFKSWMNFPSSFIQLWLLPIFCRSLTIIGQLDLSLYSNKKIAKHHQTS